MKRMIALALVATVSVSCAAHKEKKAVKNEAAKISPTIDPTRQYARAISMVEFNPDLSLDQKKQLVTLIGDYAEKMHSYREKQSQYRTVLIDSMIENESENAAKISAAKKSLTELNKENSKRLEAFVDDFKHVVGTSAKNHQPELLEIILVE